MNKPNITLSNEAGHDPILKLLLEERSINADYNIAAIKAQCVDKLPVHWKMLSPIQRYKSKMKGISIDKARQTF